MPRFILRIWRNKPWVLKCRSRRASMSRFFISRKAI